MKTRFYVVGIVLLLVVGAYSAYWYVRAEHIEKILKAEIANLSEHATITYDGIQKKGYPYSIQIAFVNPKVHVENEAISFDLKGSLAGRWSVFGDINDIEMAGISRLSLPINEAGPLTEYHFEGTTVAEIDSLKTLADRGQIKITNGKAYSVGNNLHGPFVWIFDLLTVDYDVDNASVDRSGISLDVRLRGAEHKGVAQGEHLPVDLYNVFAGTIAEKSGKTNSSFVVNCDLPSLAKCQQLMASPLLLLTQTLPKVSIDIKKLNSFNALSSDEISGSIHILEDDQKNIVIQIDGKGFIHFFAPYHDAVVAAIDNVKNAAPKWEAPQELSEVKDLIANDADKLKVLVPHPDALGKIEGLENLLIVISKNTFNWHLALNSLDVSCDLYGIAIKANAQSRNNNMQVDVGVSLKNAAGLVQDVVSMYNRVQSVAYIFEPYTQKHLKALPKEASAKIVDFLQLLSIKKDVDKTDLHINISYNDGKLMIGSLTREEARAQAEELWSEIMEEIKPTEPSPSATP